MIAIRRYTPEDRAAVSRLLVSAFLDDPGYEHAFPTKREDALAFIMPRLLTMRFGAGTVRLAVVEDEPVGVLASTPSSVRFGMLDYVRHGLPLMPFRFGLATTKRMLAADGDIAALRNTVQPAVHHQYLAQLACHPDHQGKGIGTALMRDFLEHDVDSVGEQALLMTTKSENVLWYEKFGFQIEGQAGIGDAFTAWCMVRPIR